jgi:hypothetical protein
MLELLIAGSNLFGSGWHFIYLTQNHFRFETKKKEYQSLGSLRESDPPPRRKRRHSLRFDGRTHT